METQVEPFALTASDISQLSACGAAFLVSLAQLCIVSGYRTILKVSKILKFQISQIVNSVLDLIVCFRIYH